VQTLGADNRLDIIVLQNMARHLVLKPVSWHIAYKLEIFSPWDVFGVGKSNWHKRYAAHFREMERQLLLHHNRCLMAVINKI
jgi:hypothetical protein